MKILSVDYDALMDALKTASCEIKKAHPLAVRILLFGSFCRGNYTPESDIDLLIILKETGVPFLRRKDAFSDFFKQIPFDLNMLVYTEKEIGDMLKDGNPFIGDIMEEATEL
ncbi:MAG: nucleotidyltransferase domain-containing protein [Deltaproteobacteria bacterium]|nr:nucleotidyltransferase domain-containing protein [Deltaproteobacteria bacterium]